MPIVAVNRLIEKYQRNDLRLHSLKIISLAVEDKDGIFSEYFVTSQKETIAMAEESKDRSRGVSIGNAGGNISIGGSVAGRDMNTKVGGNVISGDNVVISGGKYVGGDDNSVTGWSAQDVENFFAKLSQKIDAKPELAPADKADLKAEVQDLQAEVAKGEEANESFLERRLRNIKRMAPDILDTIATTLASPQAGLAMVIRKVMIKAKAGA
jgi:hypothetical protein